VPLFENLPAEQITAQAGILSINVLDDILAVESGYEDGCRWGAILSERTFDGRTIFKDKGTMQSNFV